MNKFSVGDRVCCMDATPLPINVAGAALTDFSFPGGFIREGAIYCVEAAFDVTGAGVCITLIGHPVFYKGRQIPWCGDRFRKLVPRRENIRCRKVVRNSPSYPENVGP